MSILCGAFSFLSVYKSVLINLPDYKKSKNHKECKINSVEKGDENFIMIVMSEKLDEYRAKSVGRTNVEGKD